MIVKPKKVVKSGSDITVYCDNSKTYKLSSKENRGSIFPRHNWIDTEDTNLSALSLIDIMQIVAGRLDRE